MSPPRKMMITAFVLAVVGFSFQIVLQYIMRPYAQNGIYYSLLSSESMMQTVPIEDLRDAPFQSLFNIHIQPPMLDAIRTIPAQIWKSPDSHTLVRKVDRSLNVLGAVWHGFLGAIVFLWLSKIAQWRYAVSASLFFLAHPACIFYATFLDGTILSTVLILWTYYLLWNIKENPQRPITVFGIAVLLLFFTRSIFQLPSIFMFAVSLILLKVPWRKVVVFLIVTGGVAGLYLGKQYCQFGIFSTSSFTGLSLTRSVGIINTRDYGHYLKGPDNTNIQNQILPDVLTRVTKITDIPNFNHISYLKLNRHLIDVYKEYISVTPIRQIFDTYLQSIYIYFAPSSRYGIHIIVDHIPWRHFYDLIFSAPVLPCLILFAGILWVIRRGRKNYAAGTALLLPALYIFLFSILFEQGENMRLKFLLEPVFFVFIMSQLYMTGEEIYRRISTKSVL